MKLIIGGERDKELLKRFKESFKLLLLFAFILIGIRMYPVFSNASYHGGKRFFYVLAADPVWDQMHNEYAYFKKYYFDKYEWDSDIKKSSTNTIERKL